MTSGSSSRHFLLWEKKQLSLYYCCMIYYCYFALVVSPIFFVQSFCPHRQPLLLVSNTNSYYHHHHHYSTTNPFWKQPTIHKILKMSTSNNGNEEVKSTTIPHNLLVSKMKEIGQGDGNVSLILASQSPRRREILDMIGLKDRYTVIPSPLDESALQVELSSKVANQEMDPKEYTRILAEKKAQALGDALLQNKDDDKSSHPSSSCTTTLILGSDTIVDLNGKILEKPVDVDNAIHMITSLAGKWHEVHTGVAIYGLKDDTLELIESFTETARVKFANLTQNDIEAYVQTGEPMDKAGSYGIQGIGGQLVERLDGDFFTVMGLPMHTLSLALSRALST